MPFVKIDLWKGREKAAKKKLIKNVTSAVVESIGCPQDRVHVVINEVDKENWGVGGTPADEKFPDKK
ncbi:MAG: 2-hydroxymuconate tautomerase family protein [Elusimicrobia bacterium]|nr:2-hydroxymuconate tautomerase family protein [Elusimicrobiota bacterium]